MSEIHGIPLQIIPSKARKRSIGFRITPLGVQVRTPLKYDTGILKTLLEKRKQWILAGWEKVQKKEKIKKKTYENNSLLPYFGEKIFLKIISQDKKKSYCISDGENLYLFLSAKDVGKEENFITNWYKKEAKIFLTERTLELAKLHNFSQIGNIFIKSYKAKYGMCRGKDIYLDYKIIELKKEIIDHIILHELTHLTHKHHQTSFRKRLSELDPNWKEHRDTLRGKLD